MNHSQQRFETLLSRAEQILTEAAKETKPAQRVYEKDLRTPMFHLQALSRVYRELADKGTFDKLKDRFKQVEDAIGKADFYAAFAKTFETDTSVSPVVKEYCVEKAGEQFSRLALVLEEEGWISGERIRKIRKKLSGTEWLQPDREHDSLRNFYLEEIEEVKEFMQETTTQFDNVEEDLHELRRKLRWFSIYAQSLQGAVQLAPDQAADERLQKYLTPAVLQSPFNKLPPAPAGITPVLLNENNFLALSWAINELGTLKDAGLKLVVQQEAFMAMKGLKEEEALQKAMEQADNKQPDMSVLLEKASATTAQFFRDEVLYNLVKK